MGAVPRWQCCLAFADEASANPVVHYLILHDCPALAFATLPIVDLRPTAQVLVPSEFLLRARHIWAAADVLGALTGGELEYLAAGKLSGAATDEQHQAG
jgi:hypothetical protein